MTTMDTLVNVYKNIKEGRTEDYNSEFVIDMLLAKEGIKKAIKLMRENNIPYSEETMFKILKREGVYKYF